MNAKSELVDAGQCAGEGKMAAGVVELCTSLRRVYTQQRRSVYIAFFMYTYIHDSTRLTTGNQCRDLSNGWDGLRYDALHTVSMGDFHGLSIMCAKGYITIGFRAQSHSFTL